MSYSKSFPRTLKGSNYPVWEEIFLTKEEEKQSEKDCRIENIRLMQECIEDSKGVMKRKNLEYSEKELITMAIALFDKRAGHAVHWKESKAKEKFDKKFSV